MNTLIPILLMLGAAALSIFILRRARANSLRSGSVLLMANIAEGTRDDSEITYYVDAPVTERFLLVKRGSAADRVAICAAADTPIGVLSDEASAIGDPVNVALLGGGLTHTIKMVASAAIALDALVEPAAAGRVATLGAGVGTHHVVGRAIQSAAAAGEVIEVVPMYFLRVI